MRVRELTRRYGVLLIFDEVKTGLTVAPGGGTEYSGVKPDIVALAKCLGGGVPCGAIGGTDEVFSEVENFNVWQVGTFNGNPLAMAAAKATLFYVLTPAGYEHLAAVREQLADGCEHVIADHELPAYTVTLGAKRCVTFTTEKVVHYQSYCDYQHAEMMHLAWLYMANRGIYAAPRRDQQFTISVQHSPEHADPYAEVFRQIARELTASQAEHARAAPARSNRERRTARSAKPTGRSCLQSGSGGR